VTDLVTLGSPLGIRNIVFDRLVPAPTVVNGVRRGAWPGRVSRWTNVADRWDFVALVKRLHPHFGEEIADLEITNGATVHAVERYLTAGEVGRAIARGLRAR
jgi:hypothetical protein